MGQDDQKEDEDGDISGTENTSKFSNLNKKDIDGTTLKRKRSYEAGK